MTFSIEQTKIQTNLWLLALGFLVLLSSSGHYAVANPMEGSILNTTVERAKGLGMALSEDHGPDWDSRIDGSKQTLDEFMKVCRQGNSDDDRFKEWLNQHIEPHRRKHEFFTAQLAYNFLYWMRANSKFAEDNTYHNETPLEQLTEDMISSTRMYPERTLKAFMDKVFADSTIDERRRFLRYLKVYRAKKSPHAKSSGIELGNFYTLLGLYYHYILWLDQMRGLSWLEGRMVKGQENILSQSKRHTMKLIEEWKHKWPSPEQGFRSLALHMVEQDMNSRWKLEEVDPKDYKPENHMSLLEFRAFLTRELKASREDQSHFLIWLKIKHHISDDYKIYNQKDLFLNYAHSLDKKPFGEKKRIHPELFKIGAEIFSEKLHTKYRDKLHAFHLHELIKEFDTGLYDKAKFEDYAVRKGYSLLEYKKGEVWDKDALKLAYMRWEFDESPQKIKKNHIKEALNNWRSCCHKGFSSCFQNFKGFFSSLLTKMKRLFQHKD